MPGDGSQNWSDIYAYDNSRVQNGDIYHNAPVTNYHGDFHHHGKTREQLVLDSLYFEGMENQYGRPTDSFPGTWDWIFGELDDFVCAEHDNTEFYREFCFACRESYEMEFKRQESVKFKEWLRSSDGTFWICGKAGSGKSCLMKYLYDHRQTEALLEQWTKKDLFTASFFFWAAGNELSRSLEGLMRSIIHQILQSHQDLIQLVLAQRHDASHATLGRPWSLRELSITFEKIVDSLSSSTRFCFFIDGLDEFGGVHQELLSLFKKTAKTSAIKFCVSSRPWSVFEAAYGEQEECRFYLHELTCHDIRLLVEGKLGSDEHFEQLLSREPAAVRILDNVAESAEGVFLWVALTIGELQSALGDGADFKTLKRVLNEIPQDLEKFLEHIMKSVKRHNRVNMARLLLTMQGPWRRQTLLDVTYLDCALEDPDRWLNAESVPTSKAELRAILSQSEIAAKTWCKDLVIVTKPDMNTWGDENARILNLKDCGEVSFAHRTIYDFVCDATRRTWLEEVAGSDFSPHWYLLCARLYIIKRGIGIATGPYPVLYYNVRDLVAELDLVVRHEPHRPFMRLMEELDAVLQADHAKYVEERPFSMYHWTASLQEFDGPHYLIKPADDDQLYALFPFIIHCAAWSYYRHVIDAEWAIASSNQKNFWLESALVPWLFGFNYFPWGYHEARLDIIADLLARGARLDKASMRFDGKSRDVWQSFVSFLHAESEAVDHNIDLMALLLANGADPDAHIWCWFSSRHDISPEQWILVRYIPVELEEKINSQLHEDCRERETIVDLVYESNQWNNGTGEKVTVRYKLCSIPAIDAVEAIRIVVADELRFVKARFYDSIRQLLIEASKAKRRNALLKLRLCVRWRVRIRPKHRLKTAMQLRVLARVARAKEDSLRA